MTYEEYRQEVKKHLTERRFFHSECVVEKARLAGILHDIMKETPGEEQLKMMERFGIMLTQAQRRTPKLWHAFAAAAYIQHVLGLEDQEIIEILIDALIERRLNRPTK